MIHIKFNKRSNRDTSVTVNSADLELDCKDLKKGDLFLIKVKGKDKRFHFVPFIVNRKSGKTLASSSWPRACSSIKFGEPKEFYVYSTLFCGNLNGEDFDEE